MNEAGDPSSALFGVDGTELPDPLPVLPDPLTGLDRVAWPEIPAIPPTSLPAMPDVDAMRAAITAAFNENAAGEPEPGAPGAAETGPIPVPGAQPPGAGTAAPRYAVPRPVEQARRQGLIPPGPHPPQAAAAQRPGVSGPAAAYRPVPPTGLRRRSSRELTSGARLRPAGGARGGCVIVLIIVAVVALNVMLGFVQSVPVMFP